MDEILDIVNENDEVAGQELRRKIYNDGLQGNRFIYEYDKDGIQELEWFKINTIIEMIKKEPNKFKGDLLPVLKWYLSKGKEDENIDKLFKSSSFNGPGLASLGDDIIYSNAVGWADKENGIKNNLNTKFQIGSVTKQFTAAAIMMLQDDGLLQLDKIVPKNKVVYNINYREG